MAPGGRPGQHDALPRPALERRAGLRPGAAQFTVEEISEAFAAARGLALPSQLRRALRREGRDLHGEFLRLLPHRPAPIRIQRWSVRRVGSSAAVLVTAFLLVITVANVLVNTATPAAVLLSAA